LNVQKLLILSGEMELAERRVRARSGRLQPGSAGKRFTAQMNARLDAGEPLTELQVQQAAAYAWSYRRQLRADLVPPRKPPPPQHQFARAQPNYGGLRDLKAFAGE
jgi:hypothetical protein